MALVFVWVHPGAPLSGNDVEDMPPAYRDNVRAWGAAYHCHPRVLNGSACERAVAEAEAAADLPGLSTVYLRLAGMGKWIFCVDIARVAYLFVNGGVYIDTDMQVGRTALPPDVLNPTVCYLPRDDDGLLQNNFIAAPAGHPFLRRLLHASMVSALEEDAVIDATGPVAITAVHHLLSAGRLPASTGAMPEVVQVLPAYRFYVTHWHGAHEPSGRTADHCYGVHTWDVTWGKGGSYTGGEGGVGGAAQAAEGTSGEAGYAPLDYYPPLAGYGGVPSAAASAAMHTRVELVLGRLAGRMGASEAHDEAALGPTIVQISPAKFDTPAVRRVAARQARLLLPPDDDTDGGEAVSVIAVTVSGMPPLTASVSWARPSPWGPPAGVSPKGTPRLTWTLDGLSAVYPSLLDWVQMAFSPTSAATRQLVEGASPCVVLLRGVAGCGKTTALHAVVGAAGAAAKRRLSVAHVTGMEVLDGALDDRRPPAASPFFVVVDDVDDVASGDAAIALAIKVGEWKQRSAASLPVRVLLSASGAVHPALQRVVDRTVPMPLPDDAARRAILLYIAQQHGFLTDHGFLALLPSLVAACRGFSPRQLARACRLASLLRKGGASMVDGLQGGVQAVSESATAAWGSPAISLHTAAVAAAPPVSVGSPWPGFAGYDALRERLVRAVAWPLLHTAKLQRFGVGSPRGVLLYGPSGCGKTACAHALAKVCSVALVTVKGPELLSKYVGESEAAVRRLFARARSLAPCLLFLDELDAMAAKRSFGGTGGSSDGSGVHDRVLATLLNEMDGVDTTGGVVVVGATTRKDAVDAALLRAGRFDEAVEVPLPDAPSCASIFAACLERVPIADDVDVAALASAACAAAFTGADIRAACTEAAMHALRGDVGAEVVTWADFRV